MTACPRCGNSLIENNIKEPLWHKCSNCWRAAKKEPTIEIEIKTIANSTGLYAINKPDNIADVMDIVKVNASKIFRTLGSNILTSREELEGYGYLGLVDAFNTYSQEKYPKFTVYASLKVRGAIIDYLRTLNHTPSKYFKIIEKQVEDKIDNDEDVVYDAVGNVKTILNVTKNGSETSVTIEYSDYLKLQQNNTKQFISLDAYLNDSSLHKDYVNLEPSLTLKQTIREVLKLSKKLLDKKEYYVITQQFLNEASSQDVAKTLNISASRVSQIRSSALIKLKALCLLNGVTYGS